MDNNNVKKSDKNMDKNASSNKKSSDVEFANEMDAKNNNTNCK